MAEKTPLPWGTRIFLRVVIPVGIVASVAVGYLYGTVRFDSTFASILGGIGFVAFVPVAVLLAHLFYFLLHRPREE
jgi:hypothetical protein